MKIYRCAASIETATIKAEDFNTEILLSKVEDDIYFDLSGIIALKYRWKVLTLEPAE